MTIGKQQESEFPFMPGKTLIEVMELVKAMEEKFGVGAAAPVAVAPQINAPSRDQALTRILSLLRKRIDRLKQEAEEENRQKMLAALSMGLPLDEVRIHRFIPVSIYLADESKHQTAMRALERFLHALGLHSWEEKPAEQGSWFKRIIAFFKSPATKDEIEDTLRLGRRALELQLLQKNQADSDKSLAEAAKNLHEIFKDQPFGCAKIGSLVYIKTEKHGIHIITLTQRQLIEIENNPPLLRDPIEMLERLKALSPPPPKPESILLPLTPIRPPNSSEDQHPS